MSDIEPTTEQPTVDAVVAEPATVEPKPAVKEEQADVPTAVVEQTKPATQSKSRKPSPTGAVVSLDEKDPVSLSRCIVKNKFNRKSLSVHHVQRRLTELGYHDAATDKDGWYGDLTVKAVKEYQAAEGIDPTGVVDMRTLESLFHDDPNVTVTA